MIPFRTVTLDVSSGADHTRIAHACLFLRPFGIQMLLNQAIRTADRYGRQRELPQSDLRFEVLPEEWCRVRYAGPAGYVCKPD
jgi:hypothetical protein